MSAAEVTQLLKDVDFTSVMIAGALESVYDQAAAGTAQLLHDVGFSVLQVMIASGPRPRQVVDTAEPGAFASHHAATVRPPSRAVVNTPFPARRRRWSSSQRPVGGSTTSSWPPC